MVQIDTTYDERYESRNDSRRRLFDSNKNYLIYWVEEFNVIGIGRGTKRQMAILRDYNKVTNDFMWVWGIGIQTDGDGGTVEVNEITPKRLRVYGHAHNDKATLFELTDCEVEKHILMEMF